MYLLLLERYIRQNWQNVVLNDFSFLFFHFVRRLKNGIDCTRSLNGRVTVRDIFVVVKR